MEIKSSVLNHPDMSGVKKSLIKISEQDGKEKFRIKMIEYINDTSNDEDDQFFFDMMEFIRFLDPKTDSIAYTTPDKLIYLNSPGIVGENLRKWDFVYDHECLHQLWDTFGVAEKIKKEGKEYNHDLLNFASDCVINDYLSYNRKKELPIEDAITPNLIKSKFGVDYNRKEDTQYSLYLKMLGSPKKKEMEEYQKNQEKIHNGKIKPKDIKDATGNGEGGNSENKHSDEYKKGWIDGINDVLDGKVDPKTFTPKEEKSDYEKGYNDVLDQIKSGMEDGISKSSGESGGGSSDLPQIPWDAPNMQDESDKNDGNNKDKENQNGKNSENDKNQNSENAENDENDENQNGKKSNGKSGESKENKNEIDDMSGKEAAERAQKEADKAKEAAAKAKANADKAEKDDAENKGDLKSSAESAQEAAEKAQEAADKAKEAAESGDEDEARNQAKEAEKQSKRAQNQANKKEGKPGKGWSHAGHLQEDDYLVGEEEDIEEIRKRAESVIKEWQSKISGTFGEFITKCKKSAELKEKGLVTNTYKGISLWNQQMNKYINAFVKKKVFQKHREYKKTYTRVKRGSGIIKYGDPLQKGKKIKDDKLTINAAFYVDVSGSMYHCINNVFEAMFEISESIKKQFSKDKVVEDVIFKSFIFNDHIKEIKWGTKVHASGGNVEFSDIVKYMAKTTKDYMINVVITDANFSINENSVKTFMKDIDGMLLFITNEDSKPMKNVAKDLPTQVYYVLADNNFTIKEKKED